MRGAAGIPDRLCSCTDGFSTARSEPWSCLLYIASIVGCKGHRCLNGTCASENVFLKSPAPWPLNLCVPDLHSCLNFEEIFPRSLTSCFSLCPDISCSWPSWAAQPVACPLSLIEIHASGVHTRISPDELDLVEAPKIHQGKKDNVLRPTDLNSVPLEVSLFMALPENRAGVRKHGHFKEISFNLWLPSVSQCRTQVSVAAATYFTHPVLLTSQMIIH